MPRPIKNELHHLRDGDVVLFQKPNSRYWHARVKANGDWHPFSTKQSDLTRAGELACQRHDEIKFRVRNGMAPTARKFGPIADACMKKLQTKIDQGTAKVVYRDYIAITGLWIRPFFDHYNIDSIDATVIDEWDAWRRQRRSERGLGPKPPVSTLSMQHAALMEIFHYAVRQRLITHHQIPNLSKRARGVRTRRRPAFALDELDKLTIELYHWAKSPPRKRKRRNIWLRRMLEAYVVLLLSTGMRPGKESLQLRWCDVKLVEGPPPTGEQALPDRHIEITLPTSKTGQRRGIIGSSPCWYLLQKWRAFKDPHHVGDKDLIFTYWDGEQPGNIADSFERFLRDVGMLHDKDGRKRSLYSCRHNWATRMITEQGLNPLTLAKLMGTSIQMLEQHYYDLFPADVARQVAKW